MGTGRAGSPPMCKASDTATAGIVTCTVLGGTGRGTASRRGSVRNRCAVFDGPALAVARARLKDCPTQAAPADKPSSFSTTTAKSSASPIPTTVVCCGGPGAPGPPSRGAPPILTPNPAAVPCCARAASRSHKTSSKWTTNNMGLNTAPSGVPLFTLNCFDSCPPTRTATVC
jgi:hypothetical protein